jgi:hypothetical protein
MRICKRCRSTINVLWGLLNVAVAYLLICRVGSFNLRKTTHVLTLGAGVLLMSVMLARAFGRFHGGLEAAKPTRLRVPERQTR